MHDKEKNPGNSRRAFESLEVPSYPPSFRISGSSYGCPWDYFQLVFGGEEKGTVVSQH